MTLGHPPSLAVKCDKWPKTSVTVEEKGLMQNMLQSCERTCTKQVNGLFIPQLFCSFCSISRISFGTLGHLSHSSHFTARGKWNLEVNVQQAFTIQFVCTYRSGFLLSQTISSRLTVPNAGRCHDHAVIRCHSHWPTELVMKPYLRAVTTEPHCIMRTAGRCGAIV